MKPSVTKKNNFYPYLLLLIQPIFMASNIIVARGGVEYVPPVSLAFWRWLTVFIILIPFFFEEIVKKRTQFKKESYKLFFLGLMGCGICGAFPFIAGMSTTMANMGIIYTSSPIFIILLSVLFFGDKINLFRIIGLILCLFGVLIIICKGDLNYLINFKFTSGDLWMLGAAVGWAIYSIFLINWRSSFSLMARFTLIAFFGAITLFPFYIIEEFYFFNTIFDNNFIFWVLFAAISPGIIAFTLYTKVQKYVGASLAGFTLYIFSIYSAIYGIVLFDELLLSFHYYGAALVFLGVYLAKKIVK
ncbi:MAG: DMT family transporter [Candidatus Pelagibacter sp. TMED153]|nr:MAG: DMT family transporter [Candidatus Pelagibacter sp. TMED153]